MKFSHREKWNKILVFQNILKKKKKEFQKEEYFHNCFVIFIFLISH